MNKRFKTIFTYFCIGTFVLLVSGFYVVNWRAPEGIQTAIGIIQDERGETSNAKDSFDKAVQLASNQSYVYEFRGNFREKHGNISGALEDYSQSLRLTPDRPLSLVRRGHMRELQGERELALKDVSRALQLDAKNFEAHNLRAEIFANESKFKEAILDYDAMVSAEPKSAFALCMRAKTYDYLGYKEKALADLNSSLALSPANTAAYAYAYRGKILSDLGAKNKAILDLNKAIQIDPQSAMAIAFRGRVRSDIGDKKGAMEDFTRCALIAPKYASYYRGRYETPEQKFKLNPLSAADLAHGEKQLEAMLNDRPRMASMVSKGDLVWNWMVRQFAGEGLGRRVFWSKKPPAGEVFEADNAGPTEKSPIGSIRLRETSISGTPIEGERQWSAAVFELLNIRNTVDFDKSFKAALAGRISKTEYVRRVSELEFQASLSQTAFYRRIWLPNANKCGATATDFLWHLNEPNAYELWIAQYKKDEHYPNCYALSYERVIRPYLELTKNAR